jgi:hypothetical protein
MALGSLTARANVGAGTDDLAGLTLPEGFAGAVVLLDADGVLVDGANPVPVAVAGVPPGAATEVTVAAVADLLQELAVRLCDIADSVGNLMPDVAGRLRVSAESAVIASGTLTAVTTVSTVTTVTTVGTVTTMANQTNIGGFAANQHIMALTQMCEADLRRNIVIS